MTHKNLTHKNLTRRSLLPFTIGIQSLHRIWRDRCEQVRWLEVGVALLSSLAAGGVVLGAQQLGTLQALELVAFDRLVQWQPDRGPDPRLLIVGITEADIRAQNRFPLADRVIAQALQNLQQAQPAAIGLDIFRDIPNEPGQAELATQLRHPNVIAVTYLGNAPEERIPPPPNLPDSQVGFSDLLTDPDGVVRRNLLFGTAATGSTREASTSDAPVVTGFSLQLALAYLEPHHVPQITDRAEFQLGKVVFSKLKSGAGGYQTIDTGGYQTLLRYRSTDPARHIPLQQVLDRQFDPAWVKGKIVLIGMTAPSAKDMLLTPYSASRDRNRLMPGVVIHAQMVSQILSAVLEGHALPWVWDDRQEAGWILVWSLLGGVLTWRIRHGLGLALGYGMALSGLTIASWVIVTQAGWVPIVAPALGLVGAGVGMTAYRLLHRTTHDRLTNLPNRALFLKRLQQAYAASKATDTCVAVLFLDLDRFKQVNDHWGHSVGDRVLMISSQRLRSCLRWGDVLARVGGDEFALLLKPVRDLAQVTQMADQLQQAIAAPISVQHQTIFTSVSVGIVLSEEAAQPEDLLRDAHTAMYQAKASGKARQTVFAAGMRAAVMRRSHLEAELRHAIEQHALELHYQPIISLSSGTVAGFEALVRWQHPEHGFISPVEFIPLAEETGLIIPLGQWIFQQACHQLQQWHSEFPTNPPLTLSVNLSGQQFTQPDLVEYIEQTIAQVGLDGRHLKLEITESVAMHDVESAIAMLQRLKALHLQLSIDDFGTGYSSLSYLHRFPVDTLKVDRSFVSRMDATPEDASIVQTIIGLAHNLNMSVVAEGVETATQLRYLQDLGCNFGQGYFFSKPLPPDAIAKLLSTPIPWLKSL